MLDCIQHYSSTHHGVIWTQRSQLAAYATTRSSSRRTTRWSWPRSTSRSSAWVSLSLVFHEDINFAPNTDISISTEARKACLRDRCMDKDLLRFKVDMPFRHTHPRSRWERLPLSHLYLRDGVNTSVSGRSSWLFRSLSDGNDS
jgi:hypothetical protein